MADDGDREGSSAPEGGKGLIKFEVNSQTADYLDWLKDRTTLGRTKNEVARQILIQRITEMRQESYKDRS